MLNIRRGDIIYVDLGQHPKSSVQSGVRPCVVVNSYKYSPVANVCPLTSKIGKKPLWFHVTIKKEDVKGSLEKTSLILPEQITTIAKNKVICKAGCVKEDSSVMEELDMVCKRFFCKEAMDGQN